MNDVAGTVQRIVYEAGSEHAPDDPFGHCRLELFRSGAARLSNRSHGRERSWTGAIDTGLIDEIAAHLEAGGFPAVPQPRSVTPGATTHVIVLDSAEGHASAQLYGYAYQKLDGYRDAIPLLEAVERQLSLDSLKIGPPSDRALVAAAREEV